MAPSMPVPGVQRLRRKNAADPRGRRALCWAAGLFALTQAALALALANDGFLVRDATRHDRLRVLRRRIAEAPSPPKVVVLLGSSHVEFGLLSRQLIRDLTADLGRPVVVTNEALPRGGPVRSLLVMDRLLREGVVPDLVAFETFPVLFDGCETTETMSCRPGCSTPATRRCSAATTRAAPTWPGRDSWTPSAPPIPSDPT